jgi:low temperature requirement protein LtrA
VTAGTEKRVILLELFFDLVFVFALTQVTALMSNDPTWQGLGRGMLVLAALWWAWGGLCLAHERDRRRQGPAAALIPLAVEVDALVALAIAAAVSSALIAYEVNRFADARTSVRAGAG